MIVNSNFRRISFTAVLGILITANAAAQVSSVMTAPDSSLTMTVKRVKGEIFMDLNFSDDVHFTSVELDRRPDFEGNFTRFGYISFEDVESHCGHIIKKDNYPFHDSADVYYRVKLLSANGKTRIYPPVMLPAASSGG